jgi:hypothetical protein
MPSFLLRLYIIFGVTDHKPGSPGYRLYEHKGVRFFRNDQTSMSFWPVSKFSGTHLTILADSSAASSTESATKSCLPEHQV